MIDTPRQPPYRYPLHAALLALAAAAFVSQTVGSAMDLPQLAVIDKVLDAPADESWVFAGAGAALLTIAGLLAYFYSLNRFIPRRPRFSILLNGLAVGAGWGMLVYAADANYFSGPGLLSTIGIPLLVAFCALGPLAAESVIRRILRRMARAADAKGWRPMALRARMTLMLWQPGDTNLYREAGLLAHRLDDVALATALLARLGEIPRIENKEALLAIEQCARAAGNQDAVLTCLKRLREMDPGDASIEPRILDNLLKLGRNEEALAMLEADAQNTKHSQLSLRQHLNFKLGNYAQALVLARKIADREKPPYAQSLRLYEELRQAMPGNIEVLIQLGELLFKSEELERQNRAAALFEEALRVDPDRTQVHRRLAKHFFEARDLPRALHHLKTLFESYDTDPETYRLYARLAQDEEDWDKQIAILMQMLELYPDDWKAHFDLSHGLHMKRRLKEAVAAMEKALKLLPESEARSRRRLMTELENLRGESLIDELSGRGEELAGDPAAWLKLIANLIDMEKPDEAVQEGEKLIEAHPELVKDLQKCLEAGIKRTEKNFLLRDYLSDFYFKEGRYDEVLENYREMARHSLNPSDLLIAGCERILSRAPEHLDARIELALAHRQAEHWPGVMDALEPVVARRDLQISPQDRALWVEAAYRLGRHAEAHDLALELVDALEDQAGFMLMVLDLLEEMGEYDTAYRIFYQALDAQPDDKRLRARASSVEENLKNHRMRQLSAAGRDNLSPEEHYEKAELHRERGEHKLAIAHYQRAAEGDHLNSIALAKLAVTLCNQSMFDLADEVLDTVVLDRETAEAHPELKKMVFHVAEELEKMRKKESALKHYKRIFRIDASFRDVVDRIEYLS